MEKPNATLKKSTGFEKFIYGIGDIGQSAFIYTFSTCFMTIFYTNSVGIAAGVVGTMMLICRFLDGITDVIMGVVLEKTHTRWGKCRPWYLVAGITLAISLILSFRFPGFLSENGKVIYMYFSYILLNCISYTIFSITHNAMLSRMSTDPSDQNKIATIRLVGSTLASNLIYSITTAFVNSIGGMNSASAWATVSAIYGIVGGGLVALIFVFVKEKVKDAPAEKEDAGMGNSEAAPAIPLKTAFLATVKNKEFFLLLAIWFCVYCVSGAQSGSSTYYIGYVLGDWTAAGWFGIGNMICQLAAMLSTPFLLTKIDKIKLMRAVLILAAATRLAALIVPGNMALYLASSWSSALFFAPIQVTILTLVTDLVAIIAERTGIRAEGFVSMVSSVGLKLGTGIGAALTGWLLAWGQFDSTAAEQSAGALSAIIIDNVTIPGVFMLLAAVVLVFWKPGKAQVSD